jgi:uncharacterized protein YdaU (DUF1376 family)
MNYFELHIGDYAEATAHLTFVEDAAYIRMLRKYYSTEKPLPADLKAVQRLILARTKEEREAVETVLNEFFTLQNDGWHNARCDAELARFKDGEPEREVKKKNEENRLKRHREERARLFAQITAAGLHAPWNIGMAELRAMVEALPVTPPETPKPPLPATAPATPATATQTPDTNTQTPVLKPGVTHTASDQPVLSAMEGTEPTPVGLLSKVMRAFGINSNPGDMRLIALADQGVTVDTVQAACEAAKKAKPNEAIPPAYVLSILESWAKKARDLQATGAAPPLQLRAVPSEKFNPTAYVNRNRKTS